MNCFSDSKKWRVLRKTSFGIGGFFLGVWALLPGAQAGLYGPDDRVEARDVATPSLQRAIRASSAVFLSSQLAQDPNEPGFTKLVGSSLEVTFRTCSDERFAKQPAIAHCSAVLIAPNKIATNGHCADPDFFGPDVCKKLHFVFGYEYGPTDVPGVTPMQKIPNENLYHCARPLAFSYNFPGDEDFAILELDRDVIGVEPAKLNPTGITPIGTKIAMIGYPSGLPKKVEPSGVVAEKNPNMRSRVPIYRTRLDAFGRNSGSPIVNLETGEVEGLLFRGAAIDYETRNGERCYRAKQRPATQEGLEDFISAKILSDHL